KGVAQAGVQKDAGVTEAEQIEEGQQADSPNARQARSLTMSQAVVLGEEMLKVAVEGEGGSTCHVSACPQGTCGHASRVPRPARGPPRWATTRTHAGMQQQAAREEGDPDPP